MKENEEIDKELYETIMRISIVEELYFEDNILTVATIDRDVFEKQFKAMYDIVEKFFNEPITFHFESDSRSLYVRFTPARIGFEDDIVEYEDEDLYEEDEE